MPWAISACATCSFSLSGLPLFALGKKFDGGCSTAFSFSFFARAAFASSFFARTAAASSVSSCPPVGVARSVLPFPLGDLAPLSTSGRYMLLHTVTWRPRGLASAGLLDGGIGSCRSCGQLMPPRDWRSQRNNVI